jgi:hypothetical protein
MEKIKTNVKENKIKSVSILNSNSSSELFTLKHLDDSQSKVKFYKKTNILKIIAERLKNFETDFIDSQFPPTNDSLYGKNNTQTNILSTYEEDLQSLEKEKSWTRVDRLDDCNSEVIISRNEFSPFDIKQGSLSDCYYLSSLAAIAKNPRLILNLFVMVDIEKLKNIIYSNQQEKLSETSTIKNILIEFSSDNLENEKYFESLFKLNEFYQKFFPILKCFIMKIRIHGEWQYILIDGYLPTYQGRQSLIFGKSYSTDLWVSLIEKTWAKILGGYYKTSLGSPAEGFLSLTDSPVEVTTHKHLHDSNHFWEKIKLSLNSECILSCIIQLKGKKANSYKEMGLITNHCYSIIRLVQLEWNKQAMRFILLRNPHGNTNYSGNYCDSDPKWVDDLKLMVNFDEKDKGCFFMDIQDYFSLFDHTFLCKYDKDKIYKLYKISKNDVELGKGNLFLLNVKNEGNINFTLHPKSKRIFGKGIKNKMAQLIVAKVENYTQCSKDIDKWELNYLIGGNNSKSVNICEFFTTGTYLIYSNIETGLNRKVGFVISTYADKKVSENLKINLLDLKIEIDQNKLIEKILLSMCRNKLKKDYYSIDTEINKHITHKELMSYKLSTLSDCENGFGVIFIDNKNKNITINTNITIKEFESLQFMNYDVNKFFDPKGVNQISLSTPPNSHNLIFVKKKKMQCKFNLLFSENFSFSLDYLKANIKIKGEKKEISINGKNSGVCIYSIGHAKGYLFLIENSNKKSALVKMVFTKLENLFSKSKIKGTYEVNLKSGGNSYLEIPSVTPGKPISIQYKFAAVLK